MSRQLPMFGEESGEGERSGEAPDGGAVVRIETSGGAAALTKSQKAFNRLIAKIEGQRQLLASWQAFVPQFISRLANDLTPLQQRLDEQRWALLRLMDAAHDGPGVNRRERAKLSDIITSLAEGMLSRREDPALMALYDKYSEVGFEEGQQEEAEFFKAMAEEVFGVDLGKAEAPQTPEEVMEALARQMHQRQAEAATARPEPARPRSAKALAREARAQERAQGVTQTVREVYRKLASALHPDRETDDAERERKTALMQKVNQAYEKKDLLQLLELQIQAEQIDPTRLGDVSESRLKHYIVVLKEQSRELEQELLEVTRPFLQNMPFSRGPSVTPDAVLVSLQADMAELRRAIAQARSDVAAFQDLRHLKAWLKTYRIGENDMPDDFFDDLDRVFEPAPRRGGRRR